jgi:RNA polymerase sigma factor (TIGR02999 family)
MDKAPGGITISQLRKEVQLSLIAVGAITLVVYCGFWSASNMESSSGEITRLLEDLRTGQTAAVDDLMPLVYGELRKQARRYLARERRGHTLQPTALVHEVYLRLFGKTLMKWQTRAHFFAVSAQVMRRILVDHARSREARKRGGSWTKLALNEEMAGSIARPQDFLALDDAIKQLGQLDARQSQIVELRFFGGLSEEETAEVLGISARTVKRDWRLARAWLYERLAAEGKSNAKVIPKGQVELP